MEKTDFKSANCGTLHDENRCPEREVERHWEGDQYFGPVSSLDLFASAAVERLNAICAACEFYTPLKD